MFSEADRHTTAQAARRKPRTAEKFTLSAPKAPVEWTIRATPFSLRHAYPMSGALLNGALLSGALLNGAW
jgi:hypothetical protein